ncbi:scavenger receptor cysteine-rich domain-containing protein DMBT1-like [Sylvia borin]
MKGALCPPHCGFTAEQGQRGAAAFSAAAQVSGAACGRWRCREPPRGAEGGLFAPGDIRVAAHCGEVCDARSAAEAHIWARSRLLEAAAPQPGDGAPDKGCPGAAACSGSAGGETCPGCAGSGPVAWGRWRRWGCCCACGCVRVSGGRPERGPRRGRARLSRLRAAGSGELRLVDGGGRCAGRVEVKHDGEWGSVCIFDFDWKAYWATVVCRQLGCGRVAKASPYAPFGQGTGRIWLQPFFCRGYENELQECPHFGWGRHFCSHERDVGVICTDAVELRLAGGGSPCAGRVEVKLRGQWGSVGDDSWDMEDAEVVCQQLGCGSASGAYSAIETFGTGDGLVSLALVDCDGVETTLWDCEIRGWGPYNGSIHDYDTAVICQGRSWIWGGVALHSLPLTLSLCCSRRLFPAGGRRWSLRREAGGAAGPGLARCVRESGGHEGGRGGVQGAGLWGGARHRRQWPICGGVGITVGLGVPVQWHGAPPQCLCPASAPQPGLRRPCRRHLLPLHGLPAGEQLGLRRAGGGGSEGHVGVRVRQRVGPARCPRPVPPPGLRPRPDRAPGRLLRQRGGAAAAGRLRLQRERAAPGRVPRGRAGEAALCPRKRCGCQLLRCVGHLRDGPEGLLRFSRIGSSLPGCFGVKCGLSQVPQPHGSAGDFVDVGFVTSLRLVDGQSLCDGRLEETITSPAWRRVPLEQWKLWDVYMICAVLGCGIPKDIYNALGSITALSSSHSDVHLMREEMDNISGISSALSSSPEEADEELEEMDDVLGMGPEPNSSFEEMVIVCSSGCPKKGQTCWCPKQPRQPGPSMPTGSRRVRLVGSSGPCAGRVEVYSGGSWSSVCQEGWDVQDAAVVCRELGCGRALEAPRSARFGPGTGPPWPYIPECSGSEESLWECGRSEGRECGLGGGAAAVCSEHVSVRLAGGGGRCRGFLEVYHNGTWGRVCASGTGTGAAVCRQLGCGEPARLSAVPARQPSRAWLAWVGCEDGARSLWGCPSAPWHLQSCGPGGDVHVACEEDSGGITETDTGTPYPEGASSTVLPRRTTLAVAVGTVPVPVVLCVVLGTLLCLSLGALAVLLCRARCQGGFLCVGAVTDPFWGSKGPCRVEQFRRSAGVTPVPPSVPSAPGKCCLMFQALAELQMPSPMLSTRSWTILRCTSTRRCPVVQVPCQRDRSRSCPITPGTAWRGVTPRQPQDPRAPSTWPVSRPLGMAQAEPCQGRWSLPWTLSLSQIPPPGPSREHRTATTMSWMCRRRPLLPALGTSLRECHGTGGSVSSPQVGSAPLHVPQEQPLSPRKSPRHTRTMMMLAAAPWGHCHEDGLAMWQPWGHVCDSVVVPCPQEGVALPTEVTPPCPALQENSPCLGIFLDFGVPLFLLPLPRSSGMPGMEGAVAGPSSQALQRAGGMPELLAELQDTVGSQLVVTQAQAGSLEMVRVLKRLWKDGLSLGQLPSSLSRRDSRTMCSLLSRLCSVPTRSRPLPRSSGMPGMEGAVAGPSSQALQRAGGMPELLAELQDSVGSQLVVTQAQWLGWRRDVSRLRWVGAGGMGPLAALGLLLCVRLCAGSGELRLVDGGGRCAGRVEVKHDGEWGSVCVYDFGWDTRWATVVCRQLGCGRVARASPNVPVRQGTGRIWLQPFFCRGYEDALQKCLHIGWGQHFCGHERDVGVICTATLCWCIPGRAEPCRCPSADAVELRLAGGGSLCAGRVEVKLRGQWGSVGDDSWDMEDAEVVCQQLGCGSASGAYSTHERFGEGIGPVSLGQVDCDGYETTLWDCEIRGWGPYNGIIHDLDTAVVCQGFSRLVGGDGACAGQLEVQLGRGWLGVCENQVDMKVAEVVCRELGCGEALGIAGSGRFAARSGSLWDWGFQCNGTEPLLSACARRPPHSQGCSGPAGVICSPYTGFRLANSSGCAGRVEAAVRGTWGSVCASEWDLPDAHVLCRHLGCGRALTVPPGGSFGSGEGPLRPDAFGCSGSERHPGECPVAVLGKPPCAPGNAAAVSCSDVGFVTSLRLVDGQSLCDGRLEETITSPAWRRVPLEQWKLWDVYMICAVLGCGIPKDIYNALGSVTALSSSHSDVHVMREEMDNISGISSALSSSPEEADEELEEMDDVLGMGPAPNSSFEEMVIVCSSGCPKKGQTCWCPKQPRQPGPSMPTGSRRVRLVGSSGPCAGRVEVYSGGSWSSVCQEGWDVQDAAVVCRELGCGRALEAPRSARFGPGTGPPWPYIPECSGSEESLWECGRSEGRECGLGGGAAAVCSEHVSVRLAGGGGRCRGFLEVYHNGTWGRVCASRTGTGAAVCRQLGCEEPARLSAVPAQQPSRAWLAWVGCEDGARSLWGCPSAPWHLQSCGPGGDVHVACEEDSGGITETDTTPYPEGASSTVLPRRTTLAVAVGTVPVPVVLCVVLGTLLCLSLGALAVLLCRARCQGGFLCVGAVTDPFWGSKGPCRVEQFRRSAGVTPVPPSVPSAPGKCCLMFQALAELQMPSPMLSMRSWTTLRCTSTRRCPVAQVPCQRDRSRSCPITPGTARRGVTPRQPQDPRAPSTWPVSRPLGMAQAEPCQGRWSLPWTLCLSQIPPPGPSREPRTATTMSWMCRRRPPLPALGTSLRECHGTGGSVSSPQVGSAPLHVPQEQPLSPRKSPRHTRTMMMLAAAPWGHCHEDGLAMWQPWGHVCDSVVVPCPQEGVALPTEVTPPCPALQENSPCLGIFLDFGVPLFLLKP